MNIHNAIMSIPNAHMRIPNAKIRKLSWALGMLLLTLADARIYHSPDTLSDFQKLILFRQPPPTPTASTSNITIAGQGARSQSSSHDSYIRKAQMKTLRILLVTVAVFAMCWLPYYVILLFYVGNPRLASKVLPYWVFKITELIAVSNACVNPFIYGNYLLKIKERCKSCWP